MLLATRMQLRCLLVQYCFSHRTRYDNVTVRVIASILTLDVVHMVELLLATVMLLRLLLLLLLLQSSMCQRRLLAV
jgi:hypothetical protein